MRQRLLLLVLIGTLIAVPILAARQGGAAGALSSRDYSALAYLVALLAFVAGTGLTLFRDRFAQAIGAAMLWGLIGLGLVGGYAYRFELHELADRVIAELLPGRATSAGRTVAVARTEAGEFAVAAKINGAQVVMVLDTGASSVVLTRDDAKAAGLPVEVLQYTVNIDTANGRARAAPVTLDRLTIGSLTEPSIDALVAQPGQLKTSLLGMSYLNRLRSWEVRGDRLLLHGTP